MVGFPGRYFDRYLVAVWVRMLPVPPASRASTTVMVFPWKYGASPATPFFSVATSTAKLSKRTEIRSPLEIIVLLLFKILPAIADRLILPQDKIAMDNVVAR